MKTLFEAIESGDVGAVWQAVKAGAPLDEIDGNTELTPLAVAAEAGYTEIVRILLSAEADPNLGGATTPLEAAVVEGHIETVSALLEAGADVNLAVEDGFTPLMTASATGDLRLVRCLLDAGARPRKTNDDGDTAITLAQEEGHEAVVKLLRSRSRRRKAAAEESPAPEKGTEASDETRAPQTEPQETQETEAAVTDAKETGAEETGATDQETVDAPATGEAGDDSVTASGSQPEEPATDPDAKPADAAGSAATEPTEDPAPPTETAVEVPTEVPAEADKERPEGASEGSDEIGEEAASKPAKKASPPKGRRPTDAQSRPPKGDSPSPATPPTPAASHSLAESKVMIEKLEILKKRIAGSGDTPDRSAVEGFDLESTDTAGYRPLMAAAFFGELEIVEALLELSVEVDATDATDSGLTALAWAAQSESPRRFEILSALVRAGARIDRRCGHNQRTALMHAAMADVNLDRLPQERFAATARHMIELGAQTEIADRRGLTVWRLIKRDALGARTSTVYRRRLHQMLRVLEYCGAKPIASHAV